MVIWKVTTIDKSELENTLNKLQKENKKIKEVIPSTYSTDSYKEYYHVETFKIIYTEECGNYGCVWE